MSTFASLLPTTSSHFKGAFILREVVILEIPLSVIHEIPLYATNASGTYAANSPNKGYFCFVGADNGNGDPRKCQRDGQVSQLVRRPSKVKQT